MTFNPPSFSVTNKPLKPQSGSSASSGDQFPLSQTARSASVHQLKNLFFFVSWDEVSRKLLNTNKLITRPIMPVTSPNSAQITLTHPKSRFKICETPSTPIVKTTYMCSDLLRRKDYSNFIWNGDDWYRDSNNSVWHLFCVHNVSFLYIRSSNIWPKKLDFPIWHIYFAWNIYNYCIKTDAKSKYTYSYDYFHPLLCLLSISQIKSVWVVYMNCMYQSAMCQLLSIFYLNRACQRFWNNLKR